MIKVEEDAKGSCASQASLHRHENSIDKVFEQITPQVKARSQRKDLSVYFDKKPLASSRLE